jgi:hypothetical protein
MVALAFAVNAWGGWTFRVVTLDPNQNTCGMALPADTTKECGLIICFHGGMRSTVKDKGKDAYKTFLPFIDSGSYYVASPSAFAGQDWLTEKGMENTRILIYYMLKTYTINKNDINLAGVSDGCLAIIRYSLQTDHPIRRRLLFSTLPQLVVKQEDLVEQKILYQGSWHFFQGGKDRLFPTAQVYPFLKFWEQTIPETKVYWYPEGLHEFSFYAEQSGEIIRKILASD